MKISVCHPERKHKALGLCVICYYRNYDRKHPDKKKAKRDKHYQLHRDDCLASSRTWRLQNPDKLRIIKRPLNAFRRANQLLATPKWLTKKQKEEMKQFYINCPPGYHVDHIIPLISKVVCGLHVPWNLQYLTASENIAKSNKID
jgi:hypothetical protein